MILNLGAGGGGFPGNQETTKLRPWLDLHESPPYQLAQFNILALANYILVGTHVGLNDMHAKVM